MSECPICSRASLADTELCKYHKTALDNIHHAYEIWSNAMDVKWDEYLERVYELDDLGLWAREVVDHLTQQDDS